MGALLRIFVNFCFLANELVDEMEQAFPALLNGENLRRAKHPW